MLRKIIEINILFFIIAILFLVFIAKIKDVAILFFASYVIACSLNPLVDKLSKKFKRNIASAIVLLSTILVLGLFFLPIIIMAGHEIKSFVENVPQYIDYLRNLLVNTPVLNKSLLASINIGYFIKSASGLTSDFLNKSLIFSTVLS